MQQSHAITLPSPAEAQQVEGTLNRLVYLPQCDSTNRYAKEYIESFGLVGAVYTTNQTAGRGRLGRNWENDAGNGLYYTAAICEPLAQPSTLPLFASCLLCDQLARQYGITCQIKWPNDILLNGKKICGILCESVSYGETQQGRGYVCGIGINLAQPQAYFTAQNLPYATSIALACPDKTVSATQDAQHLALALTDFGFDRAMYQFAREGFAPYRDAYRKACVNLGKTVTFDLPNGAVGTGTAVDIDEAGCLVVQGADGDVKVFTGEVSVKGIYGNV